MAYTSLTSAKVQGSNVIDIKKIAQLINVIQPTDPFIREIMGFGDLQRDILKIRNQEPSKYLGASGSVGLDFFKQLGVRVPQRALMISEEQAKVIRQNNVPMEHTFGAVDYTSAASEGTFVIASPGVLLAVNTVLRFKNDAGSIISIIVTSNSPTVGGDGSATIGYKKIAGGSIGNITNTSTAKKLWVIGVYNAEGGRITEQKYQTPSVELFGLSKIETPVKVTTESEITKIDTEDELAVAMTAILAKADYVGRQINNTLLFAPDASSVTNAAGDSFDIVPGITEMSGIGSTDATSTGIGPTVFEAVINSIAKNECQAAPFTREGEMPVFDAFCGLTVSLAINSMLRTNAAPFRNQVFVEHGQNSFDVNLKKWIGVAGILRFHYDRSFDTSPQSTSILVVNKNSIIPIFKKDMFMRMAPSAADTTHSYKTWVCTNKLGLAVLVKPHVHLISNASAIET